MYSTECGSSQHSCTNVKIHVTIIDSMMEREVKERWQGDRKDQSEGVRGMGNDGLHRLYLLWVKRPQWDAAGITLGKSAWKWLRREASDVNDGVRGERGDGEVMERGAKCGQYTRKRRPSKTISSGASCPTIRSHKKKYFVASIEIEYYSPSIGSFFSNKGIVSEHEWDESTTQCAF